MKKKVNKGIEIKGGNTKINNLIIGDNSNIEINKSKSKKDNSKKSANDLEYLKQLIGENKIEECLLLLRDMSEGSLRDYSKDIIMYLSTFNSLKREKNLNLISVDQATVIRSKIVSGILDILNKASL